MRKSTLVIVVLVSFLIVACGEDNPSYVNEDPSYVNGEFHFSGITAVKKYFISVNESQQLMTITLKDRFLDRCVVDGEKYIWKSIEMYSNEEQSFMYAFHGDSLLLINISNTDQDSNAIVYIGGRAGNIYGTWRKVAKYYIKENMTIPHNNSYFTDYLVLSRDEAQYVVEFDEKKYSDDNSDFMNSVFVFDIYTALSLHHAGLFPWYLFGYSKGNREQALENAGVKIIEQSKNGETFQLRGKTYTIKINKAENVMQMGYHLGNANNIVDLDVSDGTTVCHLYYFFMYVDESLCKAENRGIEDRKSVV